MRCDVQGCKRIPYAEVYPMNGSWSYLCKKHYKEEYKKHKDEYGWYAITLWEQIRTLLNLYK